MSSPHRGWREAMAPPRAGAGHHHSEGASGECAAAEKHERRRGREKAASWKESVRARPCARHMGPLRRPPGPEVGRGVCFSDTRGAGRSGGGVRPCRDARNAPRRKERLVRAGCRRWPPQQPLKVQSAAYHRLARAWGRARGGGGSCGARQARLAVERSPGRPPSTSFPRAARRRWTSFRAARAGDA